MLTLKRLPRILLGFLLNAIAFSTIWAIQTPNTQANNSIIAQSTSNISAQPSRLWNLRDADILSVVTEISQETGKNFVVDPHINGKITLVSSTPLSKDEVYPVFLSALSMLGYAAIPSGNVIKIVPNMESGEQATLVASANTHVKSKGDEVVVRIIALSNVSATQLIPVLRPLLPQWSNITSYTPGNILLLFGKTANLDRIASIIQEIDQASNNNIQIVPLNHASAREIATVLNNLQTAARNAGEALSVSIAVDERSNSLLLSGTKLARLRLRVLIAQLDAPGNTPTGNTEVIYLRYLQAKNLAPLLGKIAENITDKGSAHNDNNFTGNTNNVLSANDASKAATTTAYIQAEPNTNAVIITAPSLLMQTLKTVIAKLDIRPAQVLVEGIIAEVDESNLTDLGIQWGSVTPSGTVASNATITSFPNFGAGVVGIMPSVQIQAVLSILQNLNGVNILSTPSIMVLDNQKATIEIGQDVPYQTGSYATTGTTSTVTPFTTIEQKPVTLKLEVTPQINLSNAIRLKLNLQNDSLQNPLNPGLNPIINTSKITNSVIINSDDILVLGGLISHTQNENINKVPILGDIPLIGAVFRQKITRQDKKNLMVFIKPIIARNSADATNITRTKYDNIGRIEEHYECDLSSIGKTPLHSMVPTWQNK
ncbi:MAG: type II secretion system protein GspD [Gammaproteobacteria bacterium RIFCSPHIGHO2_12_FULL_42_10]|nr:MAG: type II secretion system protein GspD [Gammaproteobacteria bacterium RIFCSPHIGHO2_12_FULL_42_10]